MEAQVITMIYTSTDRTDAHRCISGAFVSGILDADAAAHQDQTDSHMNAGRMDACQAYGRA